jgi:hypothetical protein
VLLVLRFGSSPGVFSHGSSVSMSRCFLNIIQPAQFLFSILNAPITLFYSKMLAILLNVLFLLQHYVNKASLRRFVST